MLQQSCLLCRHVLYCMQKVQMLQHCGVQPVIVFDGGRLPMKAAEEGSRSRYSAVMSHTSCFADCIRSRYQHMHIQCACCTRGPSLVMLLQMAMHVQTALAMPAGQDRKTRTRQQLTSRLATCKLPMSAISGQSTSPQPPHKTSSGYDLLSTTSVATLIMHMG